MFKLPHLLVLCVFAALVTSILAWPFGAGACPLRQPAVGGFHLTCSNIVTGTVPQGQFVVSLNGVALTPGKAADFTTGVNHNLTLTSTATDGTFTGLLFRLGGRVNTTTALQVPAGHSDVQVARSVCVEPYGVGGITHTDSDDKTNSSMVLRLNEDAKNLPLDVTVVVQNGHTGSVWYYSGYTLNSVGGAATNSFATKTSSLRPNSAHILSANRDINSSTNRNMISSEGGEGGAGSSSKGETGSSSEGDTDSSSDGDTDSSSNGDKGANSGVATSSNGGDTNSTSNGDSSDSSDSSLAPTSPVEAGFIVAEVILGLILVVSFAKWLFRFRNDHDQPIDYAQE